LRRGALQDAWAMVTVSEQLPDPGHLSGAPVSGRVGDALVVTAGTATVTASVDGVPLES
jgi:hypothetical protein